jgi:hypothetical protein
MLEQFLTAWNKFRIWDKKVYTPSDVNEILALQEIYKEIFKQPVDHTLLEFDQAKKQPKQEITESTKNSYKFLCLKRRGYDSYIAANANSLLLNIAEFLQSQTPKSWLEIENIDDIKKIFDIRYPNDPPNLFCLQLANWLRETLIKAQCKKETSDDINRWLDYLQRARREVFNKKENHKELRNLITATVHILQRTNEQVALKIRSHCIKDNLETLVNLGKNIVAFTFEYLVYALNAENMPLNCSIINIHNDENKMLSFLNYSPSGSNLLTLAHSRPICELFDLKWIETKIKVNENAALIKSAECDGASLVPADIIETFINKVNGEASEATVQALSHYFGKTQNTSSSGSAVSTIEICGVIRALPNEKEIILNHFIALHGLLLLFATTVLNCKEASEVASAGGDILLCFAAKEHLQFSMFCYQRLGAAITYTRSESFLGIRQAQIQSS